MNFYFQQNLYTLLKIKTKNRRKSMSHQNTQMIDSINLSPLNTSKSKAMYSFGKSTRFPELKQSNSSFYEKPNTLDKRATSFGFGVKSQLINRYQYSPSPDKYPKGSDFQVSPKKGVTIGLGRDDCKNVSIFNTTKYPAPTDYSYQNKQNAHIYTMGSKVKLPVLFPDIKTPGPGQYSAQHLSKNGSVYNSKYKSFISYKIHEQSPSKINKPQEPVLGPQTYNTAIPSTGKQILAKNKTQKSFYFDKKPRQTFYVQIKTPGPGMYNAFSEFNR